MAAALGALPGLRTLEYRGNIDDRLDVLCPVWDADAYGVMRKALPQQRIVYISPRQKRVRGVVWVILSSGLVLFLALSTVSIYMYNVLSYNELGYAMAVGTVAIMVLLALFLVIWVVYQRIFSGFVFFNFLANILYTRRRVQDACVRPDAPQGGEHDALRELEGGQIQVDPALSTALSDLSESDRQHAQHLLRMQDVSSSLQAASARLDSAHQQHKQRLPAAAATQDEEDDCNDLPPAADLDDGDEHAPALDAKLSRKVPMLLEQYLFKTAVPGSLDMRYVYIYVYIVPHVYMCVHIGAGLAGHAHVANARRHAAARLAGHVCAFVRAAGVGPAQALGAGAARGHHCLLLRGCVPVPGAVVQVRAII